MAAILSYRFRFILAYLVLLDVDVTRNITAKICEVNKSCHTLRWIFLQGFIKFDLGISEKCERQTFDGRKKERKKKKNNNKI